MPDTANRYFTSAQEDRCALRSDISIPAQFRISGGSPLKTIVHDLSLAGFSVTAMSPLKPGQICWLSLPETKTLEAQVIWWDYSQAGCAFTTLLSPAVLDTLLARYSHDPAERNL